MLIYCLDSTNPLQIPDLIDIKIEESEEEDEQEEDRVQPSPETERPLSLSSPVGMPVIKMLDVSKVKLRPRESSQKRDSNEEQEVVTRKPAWMNDLKTDNRRSVGIFLEKQELSQIRYFCAIVNVKNASSVDKIFS